jgi:galactose mutarotase-like enzyme
MFRGVPSLIAEDDLLRAVVVPSSGAQVASLVYLPTATELLYQGTGGSFRSPLYASVFSAECSFGFDDMFPTISPCFSEAFPFAGQAMPDHGEVWSLPWNCRTGSDSVSLSVNGVRFPYRLEKTLSIGGGTLRADYRLSNLSPFPFRCIWAAHPLFNVSPGTRIILPDAVRSVINAVPSAYLPDYGREYGFPLAETEGRILDLSLVPPRTVSSFMKYWCRERLPSFRCGLSDPETGLSLFLDGSSDRVRFLGVWVNAGGWGGQ